MKRIILILLASCVSFHLAAQATQQKNDSVFRIVVNYLNVQEGAKVFPMLNEAFQKAVPLDKFMATTKMVFIRSARWRRNLNHMKMV